MWDAFTGYDVRYHYLKYTCKECQSILSGMMYLFIIWSVHFVHVKKMLDDLTGYHVRSIIDLYEYIALYRPFIIWHIYKIFMSAVWINLGSFCRLM